MGKILEYSNYGSAPADDDLIFFCDYNNDNANPTTRRLLISDLNRKNYVYAAGASGLILGDDSGTSGLFIRDGGSVGVGTTSPDYKLDVETASASASVIRIISTAANSYPYLRLENDASHWGVYINGNYTSGVRSDLFEISGPTGGAGPYRLFMQSNGNVGIGHNGSLASTGAEYDLDVKGDFAVTGSYPVIIDSSIGEIKQLQTTGGVGTTNSLHIQNLAGANIDFMYNGGGTNAGMRIQTDRKIVIGQTTAKAKLHVVDATAGTNFLVQDSTNGAVIELRRDSGDTTTNSLYLTTKTAGTGAIGVGDPTTTPGAATININSSGDIDIGATAYAYKFNVYHATENIVGQFQSNDNNGARLLIRTGTGNAAATMSSIVAFPIYVGGTQKTNWMTGAMRLSDTDYFGIHYSAADPATASNVAFNSTLNLNNFYMDTVGNTRFLGDVKADAFYDKAGTSVNSYCKGRFLQMFTSPFYATTDAPVYPALGSNYTADSSTSAPNGYTNTSDKSPPATYFAVAPYAGRVQKVAVSMRNNQTANITAQVLFWSGTTLPTTSSDGCGLDINNCSHLTSSVTLNGSSPVDADNNNSFTKGFSDFTAAVTGTDDTLTFDAGDWLAFAIDTNSGSGQGTLTFVVEFNIT